MLELFNILMLTFTINQDNCSHYDIMRIKYRFKKIESNEVVNYIKLCSTYVYIIYRSLLLDLVEESIKSKCCEALIEISNEMTKYVIMEIDEDQLRKKMELAISNLYISESCNNIALEKLKGCEFKFWLN